MAQTDINAKMVEKNITEEENYFLTYLEPIRHMRWWANGRRCFNMQHNNYLLYPQMCEMAAARDILLPLQRL